MDHGYQVGAGGATPDDEMQFVVGSESKFGDQRVRWVSGYEAGRLLKRADTRDAVASFTQRVDDLTPRGAVVHDEY